MMHEVLLEDRRLFVWRVDGSGQVSAATCRSNSDDPEARDGEFGVRFRIQVMRDG